MNTNPKTGYFKNFIRIAKERLLLQVLEVVTQTSKWGKLMKGRNGKIIVSYTSCLSRIIVGAEKKKWCLLSRNLLEWDMVA